MKKIDMIVKAPHFFTMAGDGVGYQTGTAMLVNGGKIAGFADSARVDAEYAAEETLLLERHAVLPGFIDAHMHTGLAIARGLAQDTNNWMMYGLQPFDNVIGQSARDAGSRLAIVEAVRAGTTTLGDYEHQMDEVCAFIKKIGARGHVTQLIREAKRRVYDPGELYEYDPAMGETAFNRCLALYDRWHGEADGRIRILFGPQGADFLSLELLLKIQKAAKERKTKIHMHVQQGDRETYQIEKRYGKRPIAWLSDAGYLDDTLIAVHLTDANDDEAAVVARSGAGMIVCPGSIGIIDGVVPPSTAFQDAGGNCGLGSDQAPGNNCHNIISEMKSVALFNKIKYKNPETMPAWRALRMATIEGARAIGLSESIGSLEEGKRADFIAVDLKKPTMLPVYTAPMRNIVPNLVYSARGDEVALSAVDGRVIYRDGRVLAVDEETVIGDLENFVPDIGRDATEEFWRIHGTNAEFMEKGRL
ncbi:MAG: amidohydrolase family protein [Synergistaceae bacterium]|jgi:5-methylthioadenosine/S-adenosylhomocysteine deaminase|nr:amidohydrolase family protein [Synergistaceae bacterium]